MFVAFLPICLMSYFESHNIYFLFINYNVNMGGGGTGGSPPPEKSIGFLSNSGPDPLKNNEATNGPSSARQRNAI